MTPAESPATCRSCGAPIEWALTHKGRRIPLDPEPSPRGNLLVDGEASSMNGTIPRVKAVKVGYGDRVSHFATCPNARRHRRRRSPP